MRRTVPFFRFIAIPDWAMIGFWQKAAGKKAPFVLALLQLDDECALSLVSVKIT
jgi:hypothetical protein